MSRLSYFRRHLEIPFFALSVGLAVAPHAFAQPAANSPSAAPAAPAPAPAAAPPPPSASFPVAPPAASTPNTAPASNPPPAAGAPPTRANPTSARAAEAEQLFKRGVERMDVGDFEAACPLLERSQAIDPSSGTLLNLGDCYEHLGRAASADKAFSSAIELARATGRNDRVQVAELRRQRLAPRLRFVTLSLPPRQPPGFAVSIDEQLVPPGVAKLPVDPGLHRVRARAPGFIEFTTEFTAPAPATALELSVPELSTATGANDSSAGADSKSGARALSGQRLAAVAFGAVGVVGVVGGSVFGLRSISKHNDAEPYCNGGGCTDQRGVDALNSARSAGNWSTAGFIVGGLGLGAATVLWFLPSKQRDTQLTLGAGSLHLSGRF